MVNFNTINRITAAYGKLITRRNNRLLNSADSVLSNTDQLQNKDRRHLADRRRKSTRVLLERRRSGDRRNRRSNKPGNNNEHSIDTLA